MSNSRSIESFQEFKKPIEDIQKLIQDLPENGLKTRALNAFQKITDSLNLAIVKFHETLDPNWDAPDDRTKVFIKGTRECLSNTQRVFEQLGTAIKSTNPAISSKADGYLTQLEQADTNQKLADLVTSMESDLLGETLDKAFAEGDAAAAAAKPAGPTLSDTDKQAFLTKANRVLDAFNRFKLAYPYSNSVNPNYSRHVSSIIELAKEYSGLAKQFQDITTNTVEKAKLDPIAFINPTNLGQGILERPSTSSGAGVSTQDDMDGLIKLQEAIINYVDTATPETAATIAGIIKSSITPPPPGTPPLPNPPTKTATPPAASPAGPTVQRAELQKKLSDLSKKFKELDDASKALPANDADKNLQNEIVSLQRIITLLKAAPGNKNIKNEMDTLKVQMIKILDDLLSKASNAGLKNALTNFKTATNEVLDSLEKQKHLVEAPFTTKEIKIPANKTYKEVLEQTLQQKLGNASATPSSPLAQMSAQTSTSSLVEQLNEKSFYLNETTLNAQTTTWTERKESGAYYSDVVVLANDINPGTFWNANYPEIKKLNISDDQFNDMFHKMCAAKQEINPTTLESRLRDITNPPIPDPKSAAKLLMTAFDKQMTQKYPADKKSGMIFPADSIFVLAMDQVIKYIKENPGQPVHINSAFSKSYAEAVILSVELYNRITLEKVGDESLRINVGNDSQYKIRPEKGQTTHRPFSENTLEKFVALLKDPMKKSTFKEPWDKIIELATENVKKDEFTSRLSP